MKIFKMIRGLFLKRSLSYKIMQNVIFHVKLLSPTLMIVKDENGNERKFYSLSSAAKLIGVSFATMHYVHKNRRRRMSRRVGGQKTFKIEWLN